MTESDPGASSHETQDDKIFWDQLMHHMGRLGVIGASTNEDELQQVRKSRNRTEALGLLLRSMLSFVPPKDNPVLRSAMRFYFDSDHTASKKPPDDFGPTKT
jgi:hypothetical protein